MPSGIRAPWACSSATTNETCQRVKLSSASPLSMSPSPIGTIGSPPRLSSVSDTVRGNCMYVAAHCLLPHPKTAKRTLSTAAAASGVSSHAAKRRALSGGWPLYTLVTTMTRPSSPLGSITLAVTSLSRECFSATMPKPLPVVRVRSAKSSALPMLEPKRTTSRLPLSASTSPTSAGCDGAVAAAGSTEGSGRSTGSARGTHLRKMPCGSRKSGAVTSSLVERSTRKWNLRTSEARQTRCSMSESCCPMQPRLP
mmetsp:Transcript_7880/g.25295  ORF Transcript_7880/g.25295 Transcript_7880/m.25295 type:complete len:254 (+) Transcript_7880:27-788(+)